MSTKKTLLATLMATTLLFSANVNAEDVIEETLDVAPAASAETGNFAFTEAPTATETTDTTVSLTWEALEDTIGYIVSYGETSVESSEGEIEFYDMESEDLIELNEYMLDWLTPNTTYYIAVTAVDQNGNETEFSPELEITTAAEWEAVMAEETPAVEEDVKDTEEVAQEESEEIAPLTILSVEAALEDQIKLSFNKALDNSEEAVREFSVTDKSTGEEVMVADTTLDETSTAVMINLESNLSTNAEYQVVVIALEAQDGTNIEAGVEWMRSFTTPAQLNSAEMPQEEEIVVEEPEVDLNAAPDEAEKLPQTGAEEVIVLFLAMILGGLVFMRKRA